MMSLHAAEYQERLALNTHAARTARYSGCRPFTVEQEASLQHTCKG